MTITLRELVENPHLETVVLAGEKGLDRKVNWAHSCDLTDPTYWLTEGVLVMTNGITIPINEEEQISYLRRIIQSKASGLAVGDGLHAPKLTNGLLELANQEKFPILLAGYEVPWIAFSKIVATANVIQEQKKVLQTLRLYELVSETIINTSPDRIIQMISKTINMKIYIIDMENKLALFQDNTTLSFFNDIKKLPLKRTHSINSFNISGRNIIYIPLSTSRPLVMFICPIDKTSIDNVILKHVATLTGLILERDTSLLERQRRIGSEIFTKMIEGVITEDIITFLLQDYGFEKGSTVIAAINKLRFNHDHLHLVLNDLKIPHLITEKENTLLLFLPDDSVAMSSIITNLPDRLHIGISNPISSNLKRVPVAYDEALWAMHSGKEHDKKVVYYSEKFPASIFITNNRKYADELVEAILGSLMEYDEKNKSQLVKTLYIYLNEVRSWKKTAEKLHIHKQTLVYRINRIEEITGKQLNDINHISEFWIAIRLARTLGKDLGLPRNM